MLRLLLEARGLVLCPPIELFIIYKRHETKETMLSLARNGCNRKKMWHFYINLSRGKNRISWL